MFKSWIGLQSVNWFPARLLSLFNCFNHKTDLQLEGKRCGSRLEKWSVPALFWPSVVITHAHICTHVVLFCRDPLWNHSWKEEEEDDVPDSQECRWEDCSCCWLLSHIFDWSLMVPSFKQSLTDTSCRSMRKWQRCLHSRERRWFWLVLRVWADAAWRTGWWCSIPHALAPLSHVWHASFYYFSISKLCHAVMQSFNWAFCSDTSRRPRDDELIGNSYHFTSRTEMEVDVKAGRFLEHGEYDGNLYGTKIESIHEVVDTGRTCILDVNPQVRRGQRSKTCHSSQSVAEVNVTCCVSPQALKVLKTAEFMPYVVFIAAPDFETLKGMHKAVVDAGITAKQLTVSQPLQGTSSAHMLMVSTATARTHVHQLAFPLCVGRMWTWGRRWMRALGSSGRTATTSTWPSSTTTWTRPLRRYRRPWTNCAVNPSGSRWTGCTEDQRTTLSGSHWPNQHVCMSVCVFLTTKAKEEEKRAEILSNKKWINPSLTARSSSGRHALQLFYYSKLKGKECLFIL